MEPLLAGLPACVRPATRRQSIRNAGPADADARRPRNYQASEPPRCGRIGAFRSAKSGSTLKVCESETGRALLRDLLNLAGIAHTASTVVVRAPSAMARVCCCRRSTRMATRTRKQRALRRGSHGGTGRSGAALQHRTLRIWNTASSCCSPRRVAHARLWQPGSSPSPSCASPCCCRGSRRAQRRARGRPDGGGAASLRSLPDASRPTAPASLRVTLDGEPVTVRLPVPPADAASPAAAAHSHRCKGKRRRRRRSPAELVAPSATQLQPPLARRCRPAAAAHLRLPSSPGSTVAAARCRHRARRWPPGASPAARRRRRRRWLGVEHEYRRLRVHGELSGGGHLELVVMYCAAAGRGALHAR